MFALDIFQKDAAETKWEYKVALVSVSLLTYILSVAAVVAVAWDKWKNKFLGWHLVFKKWTSVDSTDPNTDVQAGQAPAQSQSETNAAGSGPGGEYREFRVPKSGMNWLSRFRHAASPRAGRTRKGKEPDNSVSQAVRTPSV